MDYSKVVWDINTKFSPVEDIMRLQLFTKFGGPSFTQNRFPAKTILNFSRAWQAYFLSFDFQIWWEVTSFEDVQMMWNNDFDISTGFNFRKISVECPVHILRCPWVSTLMDIIYHIADFQKNILIVLTAFPLELKNKWYLIWKPL